MFFGRMKHIVQPRSVRCRRCERAVLLEESLIDISLPREAQDLVFLFQSQISTFDVEFEEIYARAIYLLIRLMPHRDIQNYEFPFRYFWIYRVSIEWNRFGQKLPWHVLPYRVANCKWHKAQIWIRTMDFQVDKIACCCRWHASNWVEAAHFLCICFVFFAYFFFKENRMLWARIRVLD